MHLILIIDDDLAIRTSLSLLFKQEGYEVCEMANPADGLSIIKNRNVSLVLLDMNFSIETSGEEGLAGLREIRQLNPDLPVILMTGWGSIELAVEGIKMGASDFINKPWENEHLLRSIRTALLLSDKKLSQINSSLSRAQLDQKYGFNNIIGEDSRMIEVLKTVGRVSATEVSVLITGESGTGKELIAEAIHRNSSRRNRPFIKVNLGGVSSSLFESEMFGHKRGSFTDAKHDRIGRFEMAQKGTIFLDEIGDLDLGSQVKLLRVLQDRTYEVLGDSRTRTVDVRIICATNSNLRQMVAEKSFREDLYYRINLITIDLPPLRDRPGDIPLLVNYFLNNMRTLYERGNLSISREAVAWLKNKALPGNIRELKNLVERSVVVSENDFLQVRDFQKNTDERTLHNSQLSLPEVGSMTIDEMEHSMIKKAMEFHQKNVSKVARSLGLSRGTLYRKLEKYNIPYETEK